MSTLDTKQSAPTELKTWPLLAALLTLPACVPSIALSRDLSPERDSNELQGMSIEDIPVGIHDLSSLCFSPAGLLESTLLEGTSFDGTLFCIELSPETYLQYQERLPKTRDFRNTRSLDESNARLLEFLTPQDPVITQLAEDICRGATRDEEKAQKLLDWCRATIRFDNVEESDGGNYFRFPVETLMEKCGDCEDLVLLYSSLCLAANLEVVLVRQIGHLTCAVKGNFAGKSLKLERGNYFMAETTYSTGEAIGRWHEGVITGVVIYPGKGSTP